MRSLSTACGKVASLSFATKYIERRVVSINKRRRHMYPNTYVNSPEDDTTVIPSDRGDTSDEEREVL